MLSLANNGSASPVRVSAAAAFVLMATMFFCFAMQSPYSLAAGYVSAGACLVWISWKSKAKVRIPSLHLAMGLLFICYPAIFNLLHYGFTPPLYALLTVVLLFVSRYLGSNCSPYDLVVALRALYCTFAGFIAVNLFVYWGAPEPLELVFRNSSTNGIPSYVILLQCCYSSVFFIEKRRLPLASPIVTFLIAVVGVGRASIMVATLIMLATLLINMFLLKGVGRRYGLFTNLLLIILLVMFFDDIAEYVIMNSKLAAGVVDESREQIFHEYIDRVGGISLLLGVDTKGTVIDYMYKGNPHIALLRTHMYFGLLALIACALSPLLIFLCHGTWRVAAVVFIFLVFIQIRALSEPILFPTLLDFFYSLVFFVSRQDAIRSQSYPSGLRESNRQ